MSIELFVAFLGTVILPMQGVVVVYVVSIERRLARLEAREDLRRAPRQPAVQ